MEGGFAMLDPGAGSPERLWPAEQFVEALVDLFLNSADAMALVLKSQRNCFYCSRGFMGKSF